MDDSDKTIRSQLRLPGPLHEALKEAAARGGRSLNAEIVFRLQASIDQDNANKHRRIAKLVTDNIATERTIRLLYEKMDELEAAKVNGEPWEPFGIIYERELEDPSWSPTIDDEIASVKQALESSRHAYSFERRRIRLQLAELKEEGSPSVGVIAEHLRASDIEGGKS